MRGNETKTKRRTIEETAKLYQKWRAKKSSVKEIAKAMGLNSNYLYKILPRIAETLGIPYEELIFQNHHKITESSVEGSSEISKEPQNEETVIEAEETAESVVVDVVAEATEEANTTTEAQATEEEEVETITSTEEVAAPETEVSNESEEAQDIPTNATLVEILKTLAETRSIIENLNIVQEVQK